MWKGVGKGVKVLEVLMLKNGCSGIFGSIDVGGLGGIFEIEILEVVSF